LAIKLSADMKNSVGTPSQASLSISSALSTNNPFAYTQNTTYTSVSDWLAFSSGFINYSGNYTFTVYLKTMYAAGTSYAKNIQLKFIYLDSTVNIAFSKKYGLWT